MRRIALSAVPVLVLSALLSGLTASYATGAAADQHFLVAEVPAGTVVASGNHGND